FNSARENEKGKRFKPLPLLRFPLPSPSGRRRVAARDGRQDRLQGVGRRLLELRAATFVLALRRLFVVNRESGDDAPNLYAVEGLAVEERLGELDHSVAVLFEDA